jgi:hypothetical protein
MASKAKENDCCFVVFIIFSSLHVGLFVPVITKDTFCYWYYLFYVQWRFNWKLEEMKNEEMKITQ